jgi:hypothetical protein
MSGSIAASTSSSSAARATAGDAAAAARQLKLAQWLVKNGFDARATYTFPAGADGEAEPAEVSLADAAIANLLKQYGGR